MADDAFDPTKTGAETDDDAGDDEAVDDGGLGAADDTNTDNESENASDDEHGIVGEEA